MRSPYIWPAAFYFLYFSAIAAFIPFLALYYQSLGFSGGEIGLLFGISPLVTLFASPFWTGLADAGQRHKRILFITISGVIAIMCAIPAIRSFGLLFPTIIAFAFFSAPIVSLVDSATLALLGERRNLYGRIRILGTIGWGVSAPLVGALLQRFGLYWMFWVYALLMALNLLTVRNIPFGHRSSPTPFWHGVRSLLANRRWVLFLLIAFMAGVGFALHNNYVAVLMENLGASRSTIGIAMTISILSELPVMLFSSFLLRKLKPQGLLFIALAATGLRSVLYSLAGSPQAVIAIQLAHGLTFPMLWLAGVTYTSENAPAGLGATGQGLFNATVTGFGVATGSLLGGFLLDRMSIAGMYGTVGAIILVSLLVFILINHGMKIAERKASS
jgi:PPP family 3-phenylpropionic acid transporter